MCGVCAVFNMKNAEGVTFSEKDKAFLIKFLLSELTMETESRGRDATGYFTLFQDGEGVGLKHCLKATEFCTKNWDNGEYTFKNHLDLIETYHTDISPVASAISHCRAKTQGAEADNNNNHPIYVKNIVGIHNGVLSNDDRIYEKIKDEITRIGEVDSEMIVQALWLATKKGEEKFNEGTIKEVTKKLSGSFAFIGLDKKDPDSVFVIRDTRPVEMIYLKEAGLLVVVSEEKFLTTTLEKYDSFRFYGLDTPSLTTATYTLPDDTGFILDLTTKVTADTKVEDMFSRTKIEKTGESWKEYSPTYGGTSSRNGAVYSSSRDNSIYNGYDDSSYNNHHYSNANVPAPYTPPKTETKVEENEQNNKSKIADKNVVLKKVEKKEPDSNIKLIKWDYNQKKFVEIEKDKDTFYKDIPSAIKYELFRSSKTLATRLNIEETAVDSYTSAQLANKMSKYFYETQVEPAKREVEKAKIETSKLETKTEKARKHIINLRNVINVFAKMLGKAGHIEDDFNTNETKSLKESWDFLYRNRRMELQDTTLGKFICGLKEKVAK